MKLLCYCLLPVLLACFCLSVSANAHPHKDKAKLIRPAQKPVIPPTIRRSGYCCMLLDLDRRGRTKNIRAEYCTEDILFEPSKQAIKQWKYKPFVKNGKPVAEQNRPVRTVFVTSNIFGFIIPDRDMVLVPRHFMRKGDKLVSKYEHLCKAPYVS